MLLLLSGKLTSKQSNTVRPKTPPDGKGGRPGSGSGSQMELATVTPGLHFCSPRSSVESSQWLIHLSFKTLDSKCMNTYLSLTGLACVPEKAEGKPLGMLLLGSREMFDVLILAAFGGLSF